MVNHEGEPTLSQSTPLEYFRGSKRWSTKGLFVGATIGYLAAVRSMYTTMPTRLGETLTTPRLIKIFLAGSTPLVVGMAIGANYKRFSPLNLFRRS